MADAPVVKMPPLNNVLGPIWFKYCPYRGDIKNTINSKIPNTKPYSVAVAPFFSAYKIQTKKKRDFRFLRVQKNQKHESHMKSWL